VPRLAQGRADYLTAEEIARAALRQFDKGAQRPSLRQLAGELGVSPTAIYHHFATQAQIVEAAVDLVFAEATDELFVLLPDPFDENLNPAEVLIMCGLATRRAFMRHFRIAPFMAAAPLATEWLSTTLGFMAVIFERLGLRNEDAAAAFHTYASFVIGAVIFAATRNLANEELHASGADEATASFSTADLTSAEEYTQTRLALDYVMGVSVSDPQHDEDLFALGLRRLVNSFRPSESASP
jgi:AcrR family transcriptional regulator